MVDPHSYDETHIPDEARPPLFDSVSDSDGWIDVDDDEFSAFHVLGFFLLMAIFGIGFLGCVVLLLSLLSSGV